MVREDHLTSPLTGIYGRLWTNLHPPSNALVVCDRRRIWAVSARFERWVALQIDVEGYTSGQLITILSTSNSIIRLQCLKTKVRHSLRRPLQVGESEGVSWRDRSCICNRWISRVIQESLSSIGAATSLLCRTNVNDL